MKRILFLRNIKKLKKKKRKIWQLNKVKNPESISSHIFRVAFLTWLLAKENDIDTERVIKMALLHDICKALTFEETIYDKVLDKNRKVLNNFPKLTLKEKKKYYLAKEKREEKAFEKLVEKLPEKFKYEMEKIWFEFCKGVSRESRFVYQANEAENLLQALEYNQEGNKINRKIWLNWGKRIFEEPIFIEFEKSLERRFFKKNGKRREMDNIVDFLIKLGKLKRTVREKWVLRKIKDPEKIADHIFSTTLIAWMFAEEKGLKSGKIIKLCLVHDLSRISSKRNYFNLFFPNFREQIKTIMNRPEEFSKSIKEKLLRMIKKEFIIPHSSQRSKNKESQRGYREDKKIIKNLISRLPDNLKRELFKFWDEYARALTRESSFVQQIDIIDNLFQALEHYRENNDFPIDFWWAEIGEKIEEPPLLEFIDLLYKKSKKTS